MAARKMVNGVLVDMTPDEEAAYFASLPSALDHAKAQARERILAKWSQKDALHVVIDKPNAAAYRNGTAARARALALAAAAAPDVAAVNALDIDNGWD